MVHTAAVGVVVGVLWLDIPGRVESLKFIFDEKEKLYDESVSVGNAVT